MTQVMWSPRARRDLLDLFAGIHERHSSLRNLMSEHVSAALDQIARYPEMWGRQSGDGLRCYSLPRPSIVIVYREMLSIIEVICLRQLLDIAEIEFRQARERLGVSAQDVGAWDSADDFFMGMDGRHIKDKDDVLLTRAVPVTGGVRWTGGDAQPDCVATVLMFSTGPRGVAQLECYCEPDGFAFGWEETCHLRLHRTTEEKWPK